MFVGPPRSFLRPSLLHPRCDRQLLQLPSSSLLLWQRAGVDLADMFGELKTDLEADVAFADEDPGTTTISASPSVKWFCSTRLLESCRKPARLSIFGHPFPEVIQTYTWLVQCFLERECPKPPSVGTTGR